MKCLICGAELVSQFTDGKWGHTRPGDCMDNVIHQRDELRKQLEALQPFLPMLPALAAYREALITLRSNLPGAHTWRVADQRRLEAYHEAQVKLDAALLETKKGRGGG